MLLEQNEQQIRKEELPFLRKQAKRGQTFAFIVALAGLGSAIFFGLQGMEKAAIASIFVPLDTLAVHFLGKNSPLGFSPLGNELPFCPLSHLCIEYDFGQFWLQKHYTKFHTQ